MVERVRSASQELIYSIEFFYHVDNDVPYNIPIMYSINNFYTEFKDRVEKGRDSITEEDNIDDVALGRVFTGKRASELNLSLVDRIGGYYDAIDMALPYETSHLPQH